MNKVKLPFVVVLTLSILISTIGIHVHTLYCLCKGTTKVALFSNPESECSEESSSCCLTESIHREAKSCCIVSDVAIHKKKSSCCSSETAHHPPCDKKEVQYFQLKTESITPNWVKFFNPEKIDLAEIVTFHFKKFYSSEDRTVCQTVISIPDNKAPPDPYGRYLCIFTENFRC